LESIIRTADGTPTTIAGVPAIAESSEVEASLGTDSPIAWFFASYFYLHRNSQISRTPTQLNNLRASIPGWQPSRQSSRHGTGFVKVNAQVRARHQLARILPETARLRGANGSTDSAALRAAALTRQRVADGYSAWTNTLTTFTIGASFNTFGAGRRLDAFKGPDHGGPRVLVYDSANSSAGTAGRQRSGRHHWQQPELQCHAFQQAHRASRRELVPYGLEGLS
jgi:hypothetical protein